MKPEDAPSSSKRSETLAILNSSRDRSRSLKNYKMNQLFGMMTLLSILTNFIRLGCPCKLKNSSE